MSAWILTLLPFGTALMISIVNPEFLSLLWRDPAGLRIVGVALMLMVMGVLWMWRLIKIRV